MLKHKISFLRRKNFEIFLVSQKLSKMLIILCRNTCLDVYWLVKLEKDHISERIFETINQNLNQSDFRSEIELDVELSA